MKIDRAIVESAEKWLSLLRERAKTSHYVELGSSSANDLADALEKLLGEHSALLDECKDYTVVKSRLAKLEAGAKAQQELSKAKPKPQLVKEQESDDAVA